MIGIDLILSCAPAFAPETIEQIIRVESSGNPLAIHVNKGKLDRKPISVEEAVNLAESYIQKGYSVDLGLMQVNSKNVVRLGYSIKDMFEPCKNIAAGVRVLSEFYARAKPKHDNDKAALWAALSAYNTGNFINGFSNGYVAKYGIGVPVELERVPAINPYTADTVVTLKPRKEIAMNDSKETVIPVISQSADDAETPGVQVEYTADAAEENGAFEETALTEQEAWAANADLVVDPESTGIVVAGQSVNRGEN